MPTSEEAPETKAGHPPALKVGGMRVAQRQRKDSEETKPSKEKSDKSVDNQSTSFSPFKPQVLVTGIAPKVDQRDYPKEEIKHAHEKPVPTHQPPHNSKPGVVIQQPRK